MNFNEIIKTNKSNIKNIIKLITKSENEDLEQEVYIKLWEKFREISGKRFFQELGRHNREEYL